MIDHLALSIKGKKLKAWQETENTDFSKLTLGVFYLNQAWIVRGNNLSDEVSDDKTVSFNNYLHLSKSIFSLISENSVYEAELYSRKIRLHMGLNDNETGYSYFKKVSQKYPDLIGAFIHYSELIQPKWGGSIDEVVNFKEGLPDNFLIKSIIELKLIMDAIVINDNYFVKYNEDLNDFAIEKILKIDKELLTNDLTSIHKYILYNYMEAISNNTNRRDLRTKYLKLVDGNYTIYPYGLI